MKHYFIFLFIITCAVSNAQNLVPNPSFEDTITCPMSSDAMSSALYWFSSNGSPDYLHSCAQIDAPHISAPNNSLGYQMALDGNAYAGALTYGILPPPAVNMREIIGTSLMQPLIIGEKYFVSAYISSGFSDMTQCFSNNFGFRFSTTAYYRSVNPVPIDNFSHIYETTIITDTTNWVWTGGSFIADSAYQYLMLGNFYHDVNTDTVDCIDLPNYGRIAYYYVDKVCVSTDSLENLPTGIIKTSNGTGSVSIYPNPVNDALHIEGFSNVVNCSLIDCFGNLVFQDVLHPPNAIINTTNFPNGLYTLQLNKTQFFRLIINH